jgi:hypothetical protein
MNREFADKELQEGNAARNSPLSEAGRASQLDGKSVNGLEGNDPGAAQEFRIGFQRPQIL